MNPKLIITIVFSFLYGFFEFYMSKRQKSERKVVERGDKLSVWIIITGISTGYFLSFMAASLKTGRIYHWNTLFTIGATLIVIGLIIRISSILTLRQQFTYTVTTIEDHKLIERGLYRTIRHPGYLGQLIIFLGISTTLSNWISIVLMIVPVTAAYFYRIKIEERFMLENLGDVYKGYQERTRKLIPKIY
jgi:protein-S-isoprenylcysteine O-methyltransferase Ste14